MTTEELQGIIMGFLEMEETKPEDAISAVGQSLTGLLLGSLAMYKYSDGIIKSTLGFLDNMKKVLLDVINENAPDGQKYYTLDELKEETDKLGEKLNANELDKKNRVNACNLIMDSEALGFLLLAYMKGGSVQMSSNMQDDMMTDRVLTVLKEMLYSDNHKLRKL
jgi:hypothetical protein